MSAPDEERLFRDDLAERRRERDREREPRRFRRPAPDLTARQAFQTRQVDLVNATAITVIECPTCLAPCFAPADSAGERLDCIGCDARLVTIQTAEGVAAALVPSGEP